MAKRTAAELGDAFYSGALFGEKPNMSNAFLGAARPYNQASARNDGRGQNFRLGNLLQPRVFDDAALEKARAEGYGPQDINQFLQTSGVKADGKAFRVGGMGTFEGQQGLFYQLDPNYQFPQAAAAAAPVAAPAPVASASAPVLGNPLGDQSQTVQRQRARLTIAK